MRIIEPLTIEAYGALLKTKGSGVGLDLDSMPKPVEGYAGFRAALEAGDVDRIFLWFQFREHTKDGTAKLTDSLPEMVNHERVKPYIEGVAAKGWEPIDLRSAVGFEPMLLTNDAERGPLYAIDGNHRMVAQFLVEKGFDGVPVYVCTHPKMLEWGYITKAARDWHGRAVSG